MQLEYIAQVLIIAHAGLGAIALLAGAIALIVRKGGKRHKATGKVFYYSMLASALIALVVALLPNHESPFLFSIGIFSTYFLVSGYRSLKFRRETSQLNTDRWIAYTITLTGFCMIIYPIIFFGVLNVILLVFGIVGLVFGFRDIALYKNETKLKSSWLKLHLGKMTGGYIAAVSAFFVVNEILPGIWNWFVPGILGSVFITYWMMKLNQKQSTQRRVNF